MKLSGDERDLSLRSFTHDESSVAAVTDFALLDHS